METSTDDVLIGEQTCSKTELRKCTSILENRLCDTGFGISLPPSALTVLSPYLFVCFTMDFPMFVDLFVCLSFWFVDIQNPVGFARILLVQCAFLIMVWRR